MNLPKASVGGDAPQIEDGLYVARFNGITLKEHPDWAPEGGFDKFGKADDGKRYHFGFTILDDERQPTLKQDANDPDDTLDLEATARPKPDGSMSAHEKSTSGQLMRGILTPTEFEMWVAGTLTEEMGNAIDGRDVNVKVSHNASGWPQIEQTLGPAKAKKK